MPPATQKKGAAPAGSTRVVRLDTAQYTRMLSIAKDCGKTASAADKAAFRAAVGKSGFDLSGFRSLGPRAFEVTTEEEGEEGAVRCTAFRFEDARAKAAHSATGAARAKAAHSATIVVTLNLGYNIQKNATSGSSEDAMVRRCQDAFGDSRRCTHQAARALGEMKADVCCLQEVTPDGLAQIMAHLGAEYESHRMGAAAVVWRKSLRATRIDCGGHRSKGVRSFAAIQTEDGAVFASVWLNHDDDKLAAFRVMHKWLRRCRPIDRLVIGMDSNDHDGTKLYTRIRAGEVLVAGKTLHLPAHAKVKTCCEDASYRYCGDYIADSDPRAHTAKRVDYGIAPVLLGSDGKPVRGSAKTLGSRQYMSDHLPVMYTMAK